MIGKTNKLDILRFIAYLVAAAAVVYAAAGCNAEKQAQRLANKAINNPIAYQKTGKAYILQYGCLSDTPKIVTIKGDEKIITTVMRDTIREKVPCDSFEKKTKTGTTVKVDRQGNLTIVGETLHTIRVDTTKYTVVDRTQFNICADSLNWYRMKFAVQAEQLKTKEAERKQAISEMRGWRVKFWGVLSGLALLIAAGVFLKIKGRLLV